MKYEVKTIGPVEANDILANRNTANRNINPSRVTQYSKDMLAGRWTTNGDPIRFNSEGMLVDGQHRLKAIVETSMQLDFLVVTGLEHDAVYTIDTGKARNAGDILAIDAGVPPTLAQTYASALKIYGYHHDTNRFPTGGGNALTNKRVAVLYDEQGELLLESADWSLAAATGQVALIPKGMLVALAMLFSESHELLAREFLVPVLTGVGLEDSTTQKNLRDVALRSKSKTVVYKPAVMFYTFIRCWNSFYNGRNIATMGNIVWRPQTAIPTID